MKKEIAIAILALASVASASSVQQKVESEIKQHQGNVAVFAKNLKTGDTLAINADTPVQTASVIKLPLMLQAYQQVKAGKLKLDDEIMLTKENQVAGSGVLPFLHPGMKLSVRDAIALMILLSDNTGTNMVVDAVGLKPTNEMLAGMGLKNTYFYKKVYVKAVEPLPPDFKQFGLGKTTAREMAKVMEAIYNCDLGEAKLCDDMRFLLQNQQYRAMIPRYIETADTSEDLSGIGDKIGALDAVRNDVAFVKTKNGPIVLSIFTWGNKDQSWTPENKAEMLIGRIARDIVGAWGGGGVTGGGDIVRK